MSARQQLIAVGCLRMLLHFHHRRYHTTITNLPLYLPDAYHAIQRECETLIYTSRRRFVPSNYRILVYWLRENNDNAFNTYGRTEEFSRHVNSTFNISNYLHTTRQRLFLARIKKSPLNFRLHTENLHNKK